MESQFVFPDYSDPERAVDRAVHVVGLAGGVAAIAWLGARVVASGDASLRHAAAMAIYCLGLLGMLSASAGYNLARPGRAKALLRRADHAMIYVMIAGTYTPLTLIALAPRSGVPLFILIWVLAGIGIVIRLRWPNRFEPVCLTLYLGMGWLVLFYTRALLAAVPSGVLALLVGGGVVYSLGAVVHMTAAIKFHNALWHAMVLVAAGLHLAAIALLLPIVR